MDNVTAEPLPSTSTDMRQKALDLAALGYPVFPLHPLGKLPVHNNFFTEATTDPNKVKALWTTPLGDAANFNIGILTGKGIVGVDYDVKNGGNGLQARDEHIAKGVSPSARVVTATGGEHVILRLPDKVIVGSSVRKIHPAVDTRGRNSYLVGPGSVLETDGDLVEYQWKTRLPASDLAPVPDWLLNDLLRHSRYSDSPTETSPLCDMDQPETIDRAVNYLKTSAPTAEEGNGGDHTTYSVAAHLREMGVSEDFALDLMLEHWNEQKAIPSWDADELKRKVANAYKYATGAPGALSAKADFEPVQIDETAQGIANVLPSDPDFPKPTLLDPFDTTDIEPRRFLFQRNQIARKTVTALVAPSGAGKTQFLIQLALSLTGGNPMLGLTPTHMAAAWLWNQEDELPELQRRFAAALQHHKLPHPANLYFNSGVDSRLTLVKRDDKGNLRQTKHVTRMIDRMRQLNIKLLIIDPLVEFHEAEENDNVQMAYVGGTLRRIAVEADAAVIIGHHDRKPDNASSSGHVGNQNAMRGASSLQGVTRAMYTLYQMNEADAKEHGVKLEHRHRYLRLDMAKTNVGLAGGEPIWIERRGEKMLFGHGLDAEKQEVGVLAPVDLARSSVMTAADCVDACAMAVNELAYRPGSWVDWGLVVALLSKKGWAQKNWYRPARNWEAWLGDMDGGVVPGRLFAIGIDKHRDGKKPRIRVADLNAAKLEAMLS